MSLPQPPHAAHRRVRSRLSRSGSLSLCGRWRRSLEHREAPPPAVVVIAPVTRRVRPAAARRLAIRQGPETPFSSLLFSSLGLETPFSALLFGHVKGVEGGLSWGRSLGRRSRGTVARTLALLVARTPPSSSLERPRGRPFGDADSEPTGFGDPPLLSSHRTDARRSDQRWTRHAVQRGGRDAHRDQRARITRP